MDHRRTSGSKILTFTTVAYMLVMSTAIHINDLLDRASQRSDRLHLLSTMLTQEMDSHLPLLGRLTMPRAAMCHTSPLQTPMDKEQTLQISESALMSLARSLLQAWVQPLVALSNSVTALPDPAQSSISSKLQELQEHFRHLGDGLDILSARMDPSAQAISSLPYTGTTDLGESSINFLLSCLRRDSNKIDSFLKVLRCRAAEMHSELC
ncbi:prolactin [Cololabis saira]|uniref:prolactin n=1 Tax=Cololabis saira TaxID=129043 RepID=UPI002AD2CCB5|nr:prolactin [Cololabis saira]